MRIWEQGLVATYSLPGYKALVEEHMVDMRNTGVSASRRGVTSRTLRR
jgi:hypothetical protein